MHPILERKSQSLAESCRRHSVRRLDLFGSATGSDFDPERSDLDFLVEFEDLEPRAFAAAYFGLLEELQELFELRVDLVSDSAITNPYFRESVNRTRTHLYGA